MLLERLGCRELAEYRRSVLTLLTALAVLAGGCGGSRLDAGPALSPQTTIAHPEIDECSGLVFLDGAFWTHNDSGSRPVLYRSSRPDFADAEVLELPAARAVDWEEMATYRGDLLVCDIGDNARRRDVVHLYQVRYLPGSGDQPPTAQLVADYPFAYEDGPHDAEACFTLDETVYIVTKDRGEGTLVMRFDELIPQFELMDGGVNVPRQVGTLEIGDGEKVTAGTVSPDGRYVVLLTYSGVLVYDADRLEGKPRSVTRMWARQAEALCFAGDDLIVANEQRDVFELSDFLEKRPQAAIPQRNEAELLDGAPLVNLGLHALREGEFVSWSRTGAQLRLQGRLALDHPPTVTSRDPASLGTSVILMWAKKPNRFTSDEEVVLVSGLTSTDTAATENGGRRRGGLLSAAPVGRPLWRLTGVGREPDLQPFPGTTAQVWIDEFGAIFEVEIDLDRVFPGGLPDDCRFDFKVHETRSDEEPYFSANDFYSIERPYVWGTVRFTANDWGR